MNKSPQSPPRLVISNRGEIARRVMRAARERGYVVAVISTPEDADAPVREEADAVLEVASFLDAGAVVQAAST
ncbi:MAG: carbamoyl-phosphate synthase subunit L, partial [Silvanigrellales bacterium]|nr:carbamoyl-phosphate synthase subunit L [Silvanigrellales bacterium]